MWKILICTLFVFSVTSSYADSSDNQAGSLSSIGYSSTNVIVPVNVNTSGKEAVSHSRQNDINENFTSLGTQKKGIKVDVSRDDDANCSDVTNQCSFKPRPLNVQQANQRGSGGVSQPNNNFGVQIQRQQ